MTPHDVLSLTRRSALSRGLATAAGVAVPAVFAQAPIRRVRFGISLNEDHPQGAVLRTSPTVWLCSASYVHDRAKPVPLVLASLDAQGVRHAQGQSGPDLHCHADGFGQ